MNCPFCKSKLGCNQAVSPQGYNIWFCNQCVEQDATGQITRRFFVLKTNDDNTIAGFRMHLDNCIIDNNLLQGNNFNVDILNKDDQYVTILTMKMIDNLSPFDLDVLRAKLKTILVFQ
jgi:hypothetical protein